MAHRNVKVRAHTSDFLLLILSRTIGPSPPTRTPRPPHPRSCAVSPVTMSTRSEYIKSKIAAKSTAKRRSFEETCKLMTAAKPMFDVADGAPGSSLVVEAPVDPNTGAKSRATLFRKANQAWYVLVLYSGYYNLSPPTPKHTGRHLQRKGLTSEFVITSTYRKPDASKAWAARKLLPGA